MQKESILFRDVCLKNINRPAHSSLCLKLTFTTHTSISRMVAVVMQNWPAVAFQQLVKPYGTVDIIKENWPTAQTKVGTMICFTICEGIHTAIV